MAVVQISKIQVRRGKKNSNTGVPQLSSAEFAWAVDSQELYIGNGSVAEGAPEVGNTKILTEHDNLLEFASSYQFGSDELSITDSVSRSLGDKIDEIEVSVVDFGAVGDGSTDNVTAFELAFQQLFNNSDENFRKVLKIPNGEYLFTQDLDIPSNAIIRGENRDQVILTINSNDINFTTNNGLSFANFTSSNLAENIHLSNFTISRTTGQLNISGVQNSKLESLNFTGTYQLTDPLSNIANQTGAIFWDNNLIGTRTTNITVENCSFKNNTVSIVCNQIAVFDTQIFIKNCDFEINDTAIYVQGVPQQGNNWVIYDCRFEEIAGRVLLTTAGTGTKMQKCTMTNCGNGTGDASAPLTSLISFGEYRNNILLDCSSNRQQQAGFTETLNTPYIPEVENGDLVSFIDRNYVELSLSDSFTPFAVFSSESKLTKINYTLRLNNERRTGVLTLMVDENSTVVTVSDNYSYSSLTASSASGLVTTAFEFSAILADNDGDSGTDTIILQYKNPIATGYSGVISFDVSYGV